MGGREVKVGTVGRSVLRRGLGFALYTLHVCPSCLLSLPFYLRREKSLYVRAVSTRIVSCFFLSFQLGPSWKVVVFQEPRAGEKKIERL